MELCFDRIFPEKGNASWLFSELGIAQAYIRSEYHSGTQYAFEYFEHDPNSIYDDGYIDFEENYYENQSENDPMFEGYPGTGLGY